MNDILWIGIIFILAILTSIVLGVSVVYIFNRMPATWLCDYGEEPSEELKNKGIARIKPLPWKLVLIAFFFVCGMYLALLPGKDVEVALPSLVCIWLLMMIAIADGKYMIIPDQFVVFLVLMSAGFLPFGMQIRDMIFGMLLGAGAMLIIALIGYVISKKESLGFGDVKLIAGMGMCLGLSGTASVLVIGSLASGIYYMYALFRGKVQKGDMMPLGPFLCGAGIATILLF